MQTPISVCCTLKVPPITQTHTHTHTIPKMLQVFIIVFPLPASLALYFFFVDWQISNGVTFSMDATQLLSTERGKKKKKKAEPEVEVLLGIPKFVACHCHFCIRGGAFVRFIPSQTVNSKPAAQNRTSNSYSNKSNNN